MDIRKNIAKIAFELEKNYEEQQIFELCAGERLPERKKIIEILEELRRLMFPGFFGHENTAYVSLENFAGNTLASVFETLLQQIKIALKYENRAECKKNNIIEENEKNPSQQNFAPDDYAQKITINFLKKLPQIQKSLFKDAKAQLAGDPAAESKEEVIFSYPGIYAIFVYRVAHELYKLKIPLIPRIMTEYAHGKTGIDINPGAQIGEYFFIDHGTGIVIGETTKIGNNVKIYQGVTLGALSTMEGRNLSGVKRHPTIEDGAVIYANATVLGGSTVIGKNSVVAGNAFITESIPENTKVSQEIPGLKLKTRKN